MAPRDARGINVLHGDLQQPHHAHGNALVGLGRGQRTGFTVQAADHASIEGFFGDAGLQGAGAIIDHELHERLVVRSIASYKGVDDAGAEVNRMHVVCDEHILVLRILSCALNLGYGQRHVVVDLRTTFARGLFTLLILAYHEVIQLAFYVLETLIKIHSICLVCDFKGDFFIAVHFALAPKKKTVVSMGVDFVFSYK